VIKILSCESASDFILEIKFSNGEAGHFAGQAYLADRVGSLLEPLREKAYFKQAFIDAGALCWPNGFELSGHRVFELCKLLTP
jgi:Protein of unknown function (DUF2442)